jgi:hypothetical protein
LSENTKRLFVAAGGSLHSPCSSMTAVAWAGDGVVEVLFDWVGSDQATTTTTTTTTNAQISIV